MDPFDRLVDATPVLGRAAVVAVDGVDGSGKTTFAARLAGRYAAADRAAHVVHLDDFLNPRAIRHARGRHSPEGFFRDTYDLAGFSRAVLEPLRRAGAGGTLIVPALFDHRADRPAVAGPDEVSPGGVVVVEGMFLHRDELVDAWDLSVFLDVPFEVSVARLAQGDGTSPDPTDSSMRRYVEGQRLYLASCCPQERATYVVGNV